MAKEDAVEFVKNGIKSQVSKEVITRTLKGTGFSDEEIAEAFALVESEGKKAGETIKMPPVTAAAAGAAPKLKGFRELLRETWAIYKEKFTVMVAIAFVPFAATFTMGFVLQAAGTFGGVNGYMISVALLIPVMGIAIFVSFVATLALIYALRDNIGLGDAMAESVRRSWGYLLVSGLSSLMIVGGLVLGLIPGLLFGIWFSLAPYIYVFEEERGIKVLLKSREYMRGYAGTVAWRFAALLIFGMAISFVFSFPLQFINKAAEDLLGSVIQIFMTPFFLIYFFRVYKNLVAIKPEVKASGAASNKGFLIFCATLGVVLIAGIAAVALGLGTTVISTIIREIMLKS